MWPDMISKLIQKIDKNKNNYRKMFWKLFGLKNNYFGFLKKYPEIILYFS